MITDPKERQNYWRNIVIDIVRNRQKVSKYEIKKISKLSMTTITNIINDLIQENVLLEVGLGDSIGGRRPLYLTLNPSAYHFIGIEFNNEKLYCVIIDFCNNIIYEQKYQISGLTTTANDLYSFMKTVISDAIKFMNEIPITGIGIGCPGFVDKTRGIMRFYAHQTAWKNLELQSLLEAEFGIPVIIDNNAVALALAFKHKHPEPEYYNFVILSIRSGIRLGVFVNGEVFHGASNTSGEIAHIPIPGSTRRCGCGKKGCLDAEASNSAILRKIYEGIENNRFKDLLYMVSGDISKIDIQLFIQSYLKGHKDSIELFEEVCDFLGLALASVVNLINPSKIVITGEIIAAKSFLVKEIQNKLERYAISTGLEDLSIELIDSKSFSISLGAAQIIQQKYFSIQHEFYNINSTYEIES